MKNVTAGGFPYWSRPKKGDLGIRWTSKLCSTKIINVKMKLERLPEVNSSREGQRDWPDARRKSRCLWSCQIVGRGLEKLAQSHYGATRRTSTIKGLERKFEKESTKETHSLFFLDLITFIRPRKQIQHLINKGKGSLLKLDMPSL